MQMTKGFMIVDSIMNGVKNEVKMRLEQGFDLEDLVDNRIVYTDMIYVLSNVYGLSTAQMDTIIDRYGYDVLKKYD